VTNTEGAQTMFVVSENSKNREDVSEMAKNNEIITGTRRRRERETSKIK
jgi:hypothetical protein